jgi:hypothetical protein
LINLGKATTGREKWLQRDLSKEARRQPGIVKRQQKANVQTPHKNISPNPAGQGRRRHRKAMR